MKTSVESVMRSPPVMAWFSDTVLSIVEKMVSNNIGAVIVCDNDLVPFGIITERDIIEKIVLTHKDPAKTLAQEVMSSPIISIEADKPITDALKKMRDNQIRRLAVTRNGILVGIITERRILDSLV
ncbi:MAG: CBS domain-containing protein [Candidatus Bathyarchaeia archaeon]